MLGVAALVGFLAAAPGEASAQEAQFTFNVNTDFKNLHQDVTAITIECAVCGESKCAPGGGGLGAEAIVVQTAGKADFNQRLTIPVSLRPGADPLDVKSWRCGLAEISAGAQGAGAPSPDAKEAAFRTDKSAKLVTELSGQIK